MNSNLAENMKEEKTQQQAILSKTIKKRRLKIRICCLHERCLILIQRPPKISFSDNYLPLALKMQDYF